MKLIKRLEKIASKYSDKIAVIDALFDRHYSYHDLLYDIKSLSYILHENGIKLDDRIALYFNNSYYQVVAFFSIIYIGAVPVLIDGNSCKEEIIKFLKSSNAITLIGGIDKKDILIDLSKRKDLGVFIFSNNEELIKEKTITLISYAYLRNNTNESTFNDKEGRVILFTYRGYGYPMPVVVSETALLHSITSNNFLTRIDSSLRISLILPFTHIFALTCNVLSPLSVGGTIVIIKSVMPGKILSFVENYKVNFMIVVPTLIRVFIHYIKKSGFKSSSPQRGIVGGDSFSKELFDEWLNLTGCILLQGYGLTETSAVLCNQWDNNKPDSLGKTMIGTSAKIIDEDGNELSCGRKGRLYIYTHSVMEGYHGRGDLTKEIKSDGWIDTGDIAWRDEDDFYYFVKRDKMIAKLGGITVDVKEVENVVNMHPDIQRAEIIIENDELWQEKLVCKVKTDKDLTKMDVYNFCKNYLSTSKIPKEIIVYK